MDLKVDSRHKKINLGNLDLGHSKKIGVRLGTMFLSIGLLSGCGKVNTEQEVSSIVEPIPVTTESVDTYVDTGERDDLNPVIIEDDSIHEMNSLNINEEENFADEEISPEDFQNDSIEEKIEVSIDNESPKSSVVEHEDWEVLANLDGVYAVQFDDGRVINGSYTYGDLKHVNNVMLNVEDGKNYDYLNYMPNLTSLTMADYSRGDRLKNIDGSRFQKDIQIRIDSPQYDLPFNQDTYGFLKDIPTIHDFTLGSYDCEVNVDSNYLQSLHNVENLRLGLGISSNFEYQDFRYLKSLYLDGKPYDVAMYFSNEDLDSLVASGVSVDTQNMSKVREINSNIQTIVSNLNLGENATDQEKLKAVLTYVLETSTYDEVIDKSAATGNLDLNAVSQQFYGDGSLTASFENSTQICGNYTAMTYVLCREVGLDAYNLLSSNHAWNAVEIDDYLYYVDSTWLDELPIYVSCVPVSSEDVLKSGNPEEISLLQWFMEDPNNYIDFSGVHKPIYAPASAEDSFQNIYINRNEQNSIPLMNANDAMFKVKMNEDDYTVSGAVLFGMLAGLGIGKLVPNRNKKKDNTTVYEEFYTI